MVSFHSAVQAVVVWNGWLLPVVSRFQTHSFLCPTYSRPLSCHFICVLCQSIVLSAIVFIAMKAGYSLKKTPFRKNLVIILVYALVGTFLSAIILGTSALSRSNPCVAGFLLWIVSPTFRVENQISFLEALVFGTVLSAVDPVAVIAIFDKASHAGYSSIWTTFQGKSQ